MWQAWINGIIGLWLIVASFTIAGSSTGNLANNLIAGIILLALGLWAAVANKSWQNWIIAIIGAWMIVAGFWFPASHGGNVANYLIAGALVAVAGFWAGISKAPQAKTA